MTDRQQQTPTACGGGRRASSEWNATLVRALVLLALWLLPCPAQDKPGSKEEDEVAKALVDPFTGGDVAVLKAAGLCAYGPFAWADSKRTTDVDRVLGENRVLWLETKHFRLGSNLRSVGWPEDGDERKFLIEELKALRKLLPKVPEKPKRFDPWLRLHLYAQRCEKAYHQFQQLVGHTDADFAAPGAGPYLGMPDKLLVLLFQKQSDMVRYMDRFCGRKDDTSLRFWHEKSQQMSLTVNVEGFEGMTEFGLHGHVVHAMWHNLINGYNAFKYPMPLWLGEGIAHWYSRKLPSEFLNVQIKDDEAVAEDKQANWPLKVRRRAQHDGVCFPFQKMVEWVKWDEMGYHAHAQAWSRVDYLMQKDPAKLGLLLRKVKSVPSDGTYEGQAAQIRSLALQLLQELYDLDPAGFDLKWREWVLKTYPKK